MADKASGQITINASKAEILDVIADFESYPEWAKAVKKAQVIDPGDGGRPKRAKFNVDAGVIKDEYTLDYTWGRDGVSWTLVEGRAQKHQEGSYTLSGDDGAVDVTYDLNVDMAIPVPGILKRRAEKAVIDTALKELKKRVEG
jgi:ribosome-associated toxin RatA of RatAB toxin-antitoxin module